MSVASIRPVVPTRRAAESVCPPAPAATSRTVAPGPMPARSSIRSVTGPSQSYSVGSHRSHAAAAASHCALVVVLYRAGSNVTVLITASSNSDVLDPAEEVLAGYGFQ